MINIKIQRNEPNRIIVKTDRSYDDDDFEEYDDTLQDQETDLDSKIEYRKKLIDIPKDLLPCASKLVSESSYSPPTQDEVKYYKTSGSQLVKSLMRLTFICVLIVM